MIIELILALVAGCFFGIITGITPGLHINLVAAILFSLSAFLLQYTNVIVLGCFIIAMSITHTFSDFISATYLGAPSDETALAIMPAHRLLFKGMGHEAVKLATLGSFWCLVLTIALIPVLLFAVPWIFSVLKFWIPLILAAAMAFMVIRAPTADKKFWTFVVTLLSGIFGLVVFEVPNLKDPLLPMLSGLFGISMLLLSLKEKVNLPVQRTTENLVVKKKDFWKSMSASVFCGSLVSIFPGLGPAQSSAIAMQFVGKIEEHSYLILIGGINTVSMVLSLVTMLTIQKARNGSIAIVNELVQNVDFGIFITFVLISLIAGGIATFLTLSVSKFFSGIMNKINYSLLSLGIISFVALLVFIFSGLIGIFILLISTSIGLIANLTEINRSTCMACLLLPIILLGIL